MSAVECGVWWFGEHTKLNLSKLLLRMQLRKYTLKLSTKFSKHYRVSLCCWVGSSAGAGRLAGWLAGAKVPRCRTARRTPSRVGSRWSWPQAAVRPVMWWGLVRLRGRFRCICVHEPLRVWKREGPYCAIAICVGMR